MRMMTFILVTCTLICLHISIVGAMNNYYPNRTNFTDDAIWGNFNNMVFTSEVLLAGTNVYTISPINLDTASVVIAQLNTYNTQYVKAAVLGNGSLTIYLDGILTSDSTVSIIGMTK